MLKFNYSLNISSNEKQLFLDDLYISQDLSFISGTTTNVNSCTVGEKLTVRSTYFPNDLTANVISQTMVKRNGYILVPLTLPVHTAKIVDDYGDLVEMKYVEHNGNTYYAYVGEDTFLINGIEYSASDISTLEIMDRVYVEDDKIVVDGITYDVLINKSSTPVFNDQSGEPFLHYESWDITNVTSSSTYVDKLLIGNAFNNMVECNSVTYYGHMAYTVYGGEKYYIEYFKDESGTTNGCGVTIDGDEYILTDDPDFNIYNINDYYTLEDTPVNNETNNVVQSIRPQIEINGAKSLIYFEPCQISDSGILCVETKAPNIPILLNDRITIKSTNPSTELVVKYVDDSKDNGYVYLNGRKYDVIKNLCDTIKLGGRDFILDIESAGTESNIESTTMLDGSKMYFKVSVVDENEVSRKIAKKVEHVNGEWQYVNTVQYSGETRNVIYSGSTSIDVDEHDGVQLDGYKAMVMHYENTYEQDSDTGGTINSYDYIVANTPQEYRLIVINTVGNNKFLCVPDINPYLYGKEGTKEMVIDTLYSIVGNDFVIQKRDNMFGVMDLYFDTWLKEAYDVSGGTSSYELSEMFGEVGVFLRNSYFELPVTLSNVTSNKSRYDELVIGNYYPPEEEKAINKLTDMEKDMYSPVFLNRMVNEFLPVKTISFNLHFRTRDLSTWKVIEDEGTYNPDSLPENVVVNDELSADFQYCNYFITDYYPYHDYFNTEYVEANDIEGVSGATWEQGRYSPETGSADTYWYDSSVRLQGFIILTEGQKLRIHSKSKGYCFYIYRYNMDGSFNSFDWEEKYNYTLTYEGGVKYRILLRKSIGFNEFDTIRPSDSSKYEFLTMDYGFNKDKFSSLLSNSDLLGFLWFTTDDVKMGAEKLKKSFLRLTFFDSKNPEKQNMLGTSTLYFDYGRYFNTINRTFDKEENKFHYELTEKSWQLDRTGNDTNIDIIPVYGRSEPSTTKECFYLDDNGTTNIDSLAVGEYQLKLDSRIVVSDRYENVFTSSEGFYAYILKEFADKKKEQTIYMKAEFFHAGIGVKIPMLIPTRKNDNNEYVAIKNDEWTEDVYKEFISGYDLNSVFDRLYVPITIKYSEKHRKFIYFVGDEGCYSDVVGSRYIEFTTEPGRYNNETGEKQDNYINDYHQRIPYRLTAPIKVSSLNDDYVFTIYKYKLDGTYEKSYYRDITYIELKDINYQYSIAFSHRDDNNQISQEEVQNNYIIENTNSDWVFNLFELKIKP